MWGQFTTAWPGTVPLLASGSSGHAVRSVKTYGLGDDNPMALFLHWPQSGTEDAAFGRGQGRHDRKSCEMPIRQMAPGCNPASSPWCPEPQGSEGERFSSWPPATAHCWHCTILPKPALDLASVSHAVWAVHSLSAGGIPWILKTDIGIPLWCAFAVSWWRCNQFHRAWFFAV